MSDQAPNQVATPAPQDQATKVEVVTEAVAATSEVSKEAAKPTKALDSVRFAAIAKQEAKLQAERERIKAERESLAPLQEQIKAHEEARKAAFSNPLKALEGLGITFEQLTDFVLNGEKPTAELQVSEVDRKLNEFRKEQDAEKQKALQEEKSKIEAEQSKVLADYKQELYEYIDSNKTKYELIHTFNEQDQVYQLVAAYAEQHQKVLSHQEAADLIEQELEKQVEKANSTSKFKAKAQPQQPTQADIKRQIPANSNRTISNQLTATAGSKPIKLSGEDQIKAAAQTYYALARK